MMMKSKEIGLKLGVEMVRQDRLGCLPFCGLKQETRYDHYTLKFDSSQVTAISFFIDLIYMLDYDMKQESFR